MVFRNRLGIAFALLVLAGGCSDGDSPVDRAEGRRAAVGDEASPTSTSTSVAVIDGVATTAPSSSQPASKPTPSAGRTAVLKEPGRPIDVSQSERRLTYLVQRSEFEQLERGHPRTYDVHQVVSPDKISLRWRLRNNEAEQERALTLVNGQWGGTFFELAGGDWDHCEWSPPAVAVPELKVGNSVSLDTRCVMKHPDDPQYDYPIHLTGEVKVTGTRDVGVAGQRYKTWVIERHWKEFFRGEEDERWATGLWSPDIQAFVKHDFRVRAPLGEATGRTEMAGLELY